MAVPRTRVAIILMWIAATCLLQITGGTSNIGTGDAADLSSCFGSAL
jgi:hypothetical protein